MGFFDFLKPKKNEFVELAQGALSEIFPNGELDYNSGTDEILDILNHSISKDVARNIFVKSTLICRIVTQKEEGKNKFDVDRLRLHLSGYCIQYFNEEQVKRLHGYQITLLVASLSGKSPKDIKRIEDGYAW